MSSDATSIFRGILVPIVTPMKDGGDELDEKRLIELTDGLVDSGVHGLVACGSTGEGPLLRFEERKRVTEVVVEACRGRIPVTAHVGALTTRESVSLARHAEEAGANALMAVQSFYYQLSWPETLAYHRELAEATSLPVIAYNFPASTGVRFTTDQIVELAARGYIASVKDSVGDALQLNELLLAHSNDLVVLNGWDALALDAFLHGSPGMVWGLANALPEVCVELYESAQVRGDLQRAQALWKGLWPLCDFAARNYVPSVKAACELVGLSVGPLRRPLQPLDAEDRDELGRLIKSATAA